MGTGDDSYIDYGKYQASLEDLSFRNRSILLWFSVGIIWLFLNIYVFNILWFWEEFYFSISGAEWQVVTENPDGTQCVVTEYESCERLVGTSGVWWSLLGSLTTGIAVGPLVFSALILSYRNKDVTKKWKDEIWGLLFLINPSIIWALLFLICLPHAWTLLPWGEWSTNWWKIFPFGFGLIWLGGLPPILVISKFFRKFFNREYNHDLISADEDSGGGQMPTQPTAESTASTAARSVDARSSYIEAGIPPEPSLGRGAIFAAILAALMTIPGIVLLIIGGAIAEGFIEGEGSSSYTLEIIDEETDGDQGFIIFIQGTPGDFNGNAMHDYCENVMVNANHTGYWMSNPWQGEFSYNNEADETRQVFELEISHKGSGCDAQHWPKEKWVNEVQLVKIGRACYGCMVGNTTITAEYAPFSESEATKPVGMWIQDGEKIQESTTLTIIGAILAGISGVTFTIIIIVIISKSKAAARDDFEESIEIIESIPGKPVRFRINRTDWGRDAWVGLYPSSARNQDHAGRWRWLRDIDVNNVTLPGQPAGKWSIRVFKDGGYKLENRLDFEISSPLQQPSTPTSSSDIVAGNAIITTSKSTYTIDEGVDFSFTAPKLPDDAWIGIVPVAIPHGDEAVNDSHDISYAHLAGRTNGDITLPNPGLGTWTLRLHDTDNNGRELTHVVFEVVSSPASTESLHKGRTCEINILEARAGKPIRFNVNNRPSGNEAWFGLYPVQATDQEHGEQHQNWMYFLDVAQQNTLYLPPKSAGRWSIRVFSDGGYNQIERLDFDITGAHGNAAQLHPADGRYELAPEELSWNEHNDRAIAMGGHLVSITSAEENELVARIAGGRTVWIGGMRKGSGNGTGADHWCWCDGQPWIYANWALGEPNNYGGNENRIQLHGTSKLWNDVGEGWRGPAVYQLPKEKSTQSAKKIQSALKKSSGKEKTNFWDSV